MKRKNAGKKIGRKTGNVRTPCSCWMCSYREKRDKKSWSKEEW